MYPHRPIKPEHVAEASEAIKAQIARLRQCEQWCADNTKAAFEIGLTHGRSLTKPWSARNIFYGCLKAPGNYDWRIFHIRKMRQVYGAGFDIGAAHKSLGA